MDLAWGPVAPSDWSQMAPSYKAGSVTFILQKRFLYRFMLEMDGAETSRKVETGAQMLKIIQKY